MNIYAEAKPAAGRHRWIVANETLPDGRVATIYGLAGGTFELVGRSPNGLRLVIPFTNLFDALATVREWRKGARLCLC